MPVSVGSANFDHSMHHTSITEFSGPVTVQANDPNQYAQAMKAQARLKALAGGRS
jgi:hypothetical protein